MHEGREKQERLRDKNGNGKEKKKMQGGKIILKKRKWKTGRLKRWMYLKKMKKIYEVKEKQINKNEKRRQRINLSTIKVN